MGRYARLAAHPCRCAMVCITAATNHPVAHTPKEIRISASDGPQPATVPDGDGAKAATIRPMSLSIQIEKNNTPHAKQERP
jgi:hypothetical protein